MQEEQRRMYELEYPAPVVKDDSTPDNGPTMIVAMNGYADAGQAVEASADHLKAALENRQLASFNNDELIDYRSRRPAVTSIMTVRWRLRTLTWASRCCGITPALHSCSFRALNRTCGGRPLRTR